jgi:NAD(P)-dependent dehydrogenase (short-subunit alcohol dehydrogenase family)
MEDLDGKVAVVTGAGSGIGKGLAVALAADGMRLVLADIDGQALSETGAELRESGAEVLEVVTDVRAADAVEALAAATLDAFGAVHLVCNNAGVWTLGNQWETDLADWQWVVDVNLWGAVNGIRSFVPRLLGNPDGGHVVNVASIGGLVPGPLTGPYSASKHAVVGLSKGLRAELARLDAKVGVSVVCPGKVRSGIVGRVNRRPELAGDPALTEEAKRVAEAMHDAEAGAISAEEAGLIVRDGVKRGEFWILPGAQAHRPLVERDVDELLSAFVP